MKYRFKAMWVEPCEITIEADSEIEAHVLLEALLAEPELGEKQQAAIYPHPDGGNFAIGDSVTASEFPILILPDLQAVLSSTSVLDTLRWAESQGYSIHRAGTSTQHPDEITVTDAVGLHVDGKEELVYIQATEAEILQQVGPGLVLERYANLVGRLTLIECRLGTEWTRRPMRDYLTEALMMVPPVTLWPPGITIRDHDGHTQIVDFDDNVLLTT